MVGETPNQKKAGVNPITVFLHVLAFTLFLGLAGLFIYGAVEAAGYGGVTYGIAAIGSLAASGYVASSGFEHIRSQEDRSYTTLWAKDIPQYQKYKQTEPKTPEVEKHDTPDKETPESPSLNESESNRDGNELEDSPIDEVDDNDRPNSSTNAEGAAKTTPGKSASSVSTK